MKLMHFNVYLGQNCKRDPTMEKLQALEEYLRTRDVDVIGFTECNNWDVLGVQRIAEKFGFQYAEWLEVKSSYHIVIVSKLPIERQGDSISEAPFHHGLLHVKIGGVHVLEVHMSPENSGERQAEAQAVARVAAGESVRAGEPLVVMGDFNNVSPADKSVHAEQRVQETMLSSSRAKKLEKRHMKNSQLDYDPIQVLIEAGLVEVYPDGAPGQLQWTYPTKLRDDQRDDPKIRIDYFFVNQACRDRYHLSSQILVGDAPDSLSDHYPISAQLILKT